VMKSKVITDRGALITSPFDAKRGIATALRLSVRSVCLSVCPSDRDVNDVSYRIAPLIRAILDYERVINFIYVYMYMYVS